MFGSGRPGAGAGADGSRDVGAAVSCATAPSGLAGSAGGTGVPCPVVREARIARSVASPETSLESGMGGMFALSIKVSHVDAVPLGLAPAERP